VRPGSISAPLRAEWRGRRWRIKAAAIAKGTA
jgi:hypothetical protein